MEKMVGLLEEAEQEHTQGLVANHIKNGGPVKADKEEEVMEVLMVEKLFKQQQECLALVEEQEQ